MTEKPYQCPHCQYLLKRMSRNLDFFCQNCFTSVVVLDEVWAEVMRPQDRAPQRLLTAACLRQRGTHPLVPPAKTGFLDPMVVAS